MKKGSLGLFMAIRNRKNRGWIELGSAGAGESTIRLESFFKIYKLVKIIPKSKILRRISNERMIFENLFSKLFNRANERHF